MYSQVFQEKKTKKQSLGNKVIQNKLNLRKNLLTLISSNKCKIGSLISKQCLEKVKNDLIKANAERHAKNVKDHINEIERENGSFLQLKLWKLKSKIFCTNC